MVHIVIVRAIKHDAILDKAKEIENQAHYSRAEPMVSEGTVGTH